MSSGVAVIFRVPLLLPGAFSEVMSPPAELLEMIVHENELFEGESVA